MIELFAKMQSVAAEVAEERGGIFFFGLLKTADRLDFWDLVISAFWVAEDEFPDLQYVAEKLRFRLTPEEHLAVARIVMLDPLETRLVAEGGLLDLPQGSLQLVYVPINGMIVTHAYVIAADSEGLREAVRAEAEKAAVPSSGGARTR